MQCWNSRKETDVMMMMASGKGVSSSFPCAVLVPVYERLQATSLVLGMGDLCRIIKLKGKQLQG